MDYFLPTAKTFMTPIKEKFPVDADAWRACIRGGGGEMQSWTSARDVGRAVVALCRVPRGGWEPWTFVAGEWNTFEEAVKVEERFYGSYSIACKTLFGFGHALLIFFVR